MKKVQAKHLVLVGLNFWPCRHSGDKNFWIDMIPLLAEHLDRITILSVRNNTVPIEEYSIGNCEILIKYIAPKFLEIGDLRSRRIFWRAGAFPSKLGVIEKFLHSKQIRSELKKLCTENPCKQVHLMDNLGLANRLISGFSPSPVSVSAMGYQGGSKLLYDTYLRLSYKHANLTVIPYSHAYAKKIHAIGINKDRIMNIPWGVKMPCENKNEQNQTNSNTASMVPSDKPLFLWAGYIQQIKRVDFLYALDAAKKALQKGLGVSFYFAFKPESFEKDFARFHQPEKGIFVAPTNVEQFSTLKDAADVFYSPVLNKKCIMAPPLTWIELLAKGTPILTTDVPGADEIVSNGDTGFMAKNTDDLVKQMFKIKTNFPEMKHACISKAENSYNIKNIVKKYLRLWSLEQK